MDLSAPKTAHSRWADDPVLDVTLRELFDKGLTFSQIAAGLWKFGHKFTRNAIIGRAHRLHFPPREPSGGKVKSADHIKKLSESRRVRRALGRDWTPAADVPPTPSAAGDFLGLSLLDLTASSCRYPHGDGQFTFCGQPVREGSSYCSAHHRLCYIRSNR